MNNVLYVGLSRQMTLQREMDMVANNIANADTAGFKVESLKLETDNETPKVRGGGATVSSINFVQDAGMDRDFSQGPMRSTGAPLDLGLQGDGFFAVQTAAGPRYTRDGRFSMDPTGQIVDLNGDALQGDGGSPILLNPVLGQPLIARDGTITQTDARTNISTVVGKVGAVSFPNKAALKKSGNGQYSNPTGQATTPAKGVVVMQGMLENSNVDTIQQMTRMIAVSRAYEQVANMMGQTGDTTDQAVQRLGRVPN